MKKVTLFTYFFLLTFNLSASESTKVDSILAFVYEIDKPKKVYWRLHKALTDQGLDLNDSSKLILYQLEFDNLRTIDESTIKSYHWKVCQSIVNQGIMYERLGADSELALEKFREAHIYALKNNIKSSVLWSSIRIAKHYLNTGNINSEEELYHYSLVDSLSKDENIHAETRYLGYKYLGNRHMRYNDFNVAYNYYYMAYEMAKIQNDVEQIVKLCSNLLLITDRTRDTTGNHNLIKEAASMIPDDEYHLRGLFYSNLAGYDFIMNSDKQKYYLDKALQNYNKSDNKEHLIVLYMLLGDYYCERKNVDSTLNYNNKIKQTLKLLPPTQLYYNDIFAIIYEAKYLNLTNNYQASMSTLESAFLLAKQKNAYLVIPGILEIQYKIAEENGDYEAAFEYLENYLVLNDSLNSIERQTQYQNLKVKYETEKKQGVINRLEREQVLNEEIVRAEEAKNRVLTYSLIIVFALLGLVVYMLILNRRKSKVLTQLNSVKDKIFTVLSHDLRTPLYTFNSMIEIGRVKKISPEGYPRYLTMLQNEVGNTRVLLESLLKWSQSNLNMLIIQQQRISLAKLLESVKERITQYNNRENVEVKVEIEKDFLVNTDEDLLRFILRNLCFNAIKFSPDNGVVLLRLTCHNDTPRISIIDTGVGMTKEQIEAFHKGDMEASIDAVGDKGTGLGLMLCKEFAEKLNLNIIVESQLNEGTSFYLDFSS